MVTTAPTPAQSETDEQISGSGFSRLFNEDLTPLGEAVKFVPGSKKPHISTFFRWYKPGLIVPGAVKGSPRIVLETVLVGGVRHTSREAVFRFLKAMNQPQCGGLDVPAESRAIRERRAVTVGNELEDALK